MSNGKTGLWAAAGAIVGGALGATAGRHVATNRPRGTRGGDSVEDAMVIGGATGSVFGAFFAGMVAGEPELPALPQASTQAVK